MDYVAYHDHRSEIYMGVPEGDPMTHLEHVDALLPEMGNISELIGLGELLRLARNYPQVPVQILALIMQYGDPALVDWMLM